MATREGIPPEPPLLLTVPQVVALLGLARSRLYELMASGELESVKVGRVRRIPRDALDAFVARLREES